MILPEGTKYWNDLSLLVDVSGFRAGLKIGPGFSVFTYIISDKAIMKEEILT